MRRYFLGFGSTLAAFMLTSCDGNAVSRNYVLKIEVETPDGVSTGSSLIEVRNAKRPWYSISENRFSTTVVGKAVRVDLPDGQRLYGLLRNRSGMPISDLIGRTLPRVAEVGERPDSERFQEWEMSPDNPRLPGGRSGQPMLVTFEDPEEPETLLEVDPKDFESTFGAGYKLILVSVAQTTGKLDAPQDLGLPWLEQIGRQRGAVLPNPPRLARDTEPVQTVSPLDFDTELFR